MQSSLLKRPMNDRERRSAIALARAILPSTDKMQGADEQTVRFTEGFIGNMLPEAKKPWAAAQRALAQAARLFTGKALEDLSDQEAEELVARWAEHPLLGSAVNAVASVYKITHFDRTDMRGALRHRLGVIENIEQPRWLEQIVRAEDFDDAEELECDVVVIGTGAGGAVVGRHLAEQGLAVVFVEEGEHRRRNDFEGNFVWTLEHLYRNVMTLGNAPLLIPQGRLVGGSTAVNGGSSFRPPAWVTDRWCEEFGSDEFSSDALAPYFDRTETILQVEPADTRYTGPIHDIFVRGTEALGWHHDVIRRNAPGCRGEGFCDNGCRTDARRSTNISYLPDAFARGAFLLTGMRADKLLMEGGRAVGIEGVALTRSRDEVASTRGPKRVRVKGRAVILAAGSLSSPLFLLSQGLANSSGQVGKNLTVHPSGPVIGLFDELVQGGNYIPQADFSHQFLNDGMMLLSASPDPHMAPPLLPFVGRRLMSLLEKTDHLGGVGYMISDSSKGRVRVGPLGKPLVTYNFTSEDVARSHRALVRCAEILLAAGAQEVYPGLLSPVTIRGREGLETFRQRKLKASELLLTSYHPLGTCRMSKNPRDGVVDTNHQSHDVPGLFVVDGSVVSGPLGVNPQITIMGLATRAAEKIGALLT
ncbi:MAG TPA: GMC family oxidoreductase [Polyangiaceae bacterium]|nr:GMC family oxidoreductase [Polyangiaceae bacterium]